MTVSVDDWTLTFEQGFGLGTITWTTEDVVIASSTEMLTSFLVFPGPTGPPGPQGEQGVPGLAGTDLSTYGKTLNIASPVTGPTVLTHNLNFIPAGIKFFDGAGRAADVTVIAITSTTLTISPDIAFSGSVVLS